MGRRRIGQEQLALDGQEPRGGRSLDEVSALVDWTELDRLLAGTSASAKGEPGWPPLALFRGLLRATWHDLSDVRWAEASRTEPAFAGSAALPPMSRRLSAPPLRASAPSWCAVAWTGPCSRRSRVSSISAALWSVPALWWTPP